VLSNVDGNLFDLGEKGFRNESNENRRIGFFDKGLVKGTIAADGFQ
jgi:hypothetical protein